MSPRIAVVIEVKLGGTLQVAPMLPAQKADGSLKLSVAVADLHTEISGHAILKAAGDVCAADWLHPDAPLSWLFVVSGSGGGKLKQTLTLTPEKSGWQSLRLHQLEIQP